MKKRVLKRLIVGVLAAGLMFSFKLPNVGNLGGTELTFVQKVKAEEPATVIANGTCGASSNEGGTGSVTWILYSDGKLTISGSGAIKEEAFSNYANKTSIKSVVIDSGITEIGGAAFYSCTNLTEITIPSSVTSIGGNAFRECSLSSITIPSGVTSIGTSAFQECSSLSSVEIPSSVTSIGTSAFQDCSNLISITLPCTFMNTNVSVMGVRAEATKNYVHKNSASAETCTRVEKAGSCLTNTNATYELTCPGKLTITGTGTIPSSFASYVGIGRLIKNVIIESGITEIGNSAFYNCSSLSSVTIPNSVTSIGDYAFLYCSNLNSVTIPCRFKNIDVNKIPSKATKTLVHNIPDGETACVTVDKSDTCGTNATYELTCGGKLTISGTGAIDNYAFNWIDGIKNVVIESGITSIGAEAFSGKSDLSSIEIPDSVTSIGENAFKNCSSLSSITISNYVTSMGSSVFDGCSNLSDITIPCRFKSQVIRLSGASVNYIHHTPDGVNCDVILAEGNCGKYNSETDSYGDNASYKLKCDGILTINGTGAIVDNVPWYAESVIINSGIDTIGRYAFSYCYYIKSVTIPNGVTSIGEEAFRYCRNLTSIEIPDSVTSIGEKAFQTYYNYTSLSKIYIPRSVKTIGDKGLDRGQYDNETLPQMTVYYAGTEAEWEALKSKVSNGTLIDDYTTVKCNATMCDYRGKAHDFAGQPYQKTADGKKHYQKCKNCEGVSEAVAHAYGSTWTKDATNHSKTCVCGDVVSGAHKDKDSNGLCDTCGYKMSVNTQDEQQKKEQQVNAFTTRMYSVALGRTPDENGQKDWAENLLSGKMDGASIARGFICSEEFVNKKYSNDKYLEVLYQTFMGRASDVGGKAYWIDKLKNGVSRTEVLAGFVNSKEFGGICENYGIARGTMEADGTNIYNQNVRNFVLRNYNKALARKGEVEGIEYWSYRINKGIMKPVDVARSFFQSKEFTDKKLSDADYVEVLYQTFMGRSSDSDGKAYWIKELQSGKNRDEVMNGFAYSKEFGEIMKGFGL